MADPFIKLAEFLTAGHRVAKASVGLQVGGPYKDESQEFFDLREAFGISGYMTSGEALAAIQRSTSG